MQAATIAGTMWMVLTAWVQFILPQNDWFVFSMVLGVILLILAIVNHIRIFIVIRRHNNEVRDAVSGQNLSAIYIYTRKESGHRYANSYRCLNDFLGSWISRQYVDRVTWRQIRVLVRLDYIPSLREFVSESFTLLGSVY